MAEVRKEPSARRGDGPEPDVSARTLDLEALAADCPRVDDLLRRAASTAPERVALRTEQASLTYRALDEAATRCATALRHRLDGEQGVVVALTAVFDPAFAVAYYGILRSGNVGAVVNPLLREEGLEHVLGRCAARLAVASPELARRIGTVRSRLPALEAVLLTDRPWEDGPATEPPLVEGLPAPDRDPDSVACIQFTSGTTGAPKAVRLTHRNLTVNAAQTSRAHGLDGSSVMLNYLPSFHPMHLNIGVEAAATQVLCADEDIVDSVASANRHGATHYYSLPVKLARLAADPRLPGLRLRTVRALLSGGSALAPATTVALSERFGIPVVQGYGLAEASPSTHFDRLDRPKPGSSGPTVAGTECRVVHLDTRRPLPTGEKGEIQVRGPQLMPGYLGEDRSTAFDADGWFSSGDVGYLDEDGYLFVVDRIKDVFKCDNWLVAPSEIEGVLARHPAVAECVVFDCPDRFSGSVAYGLVVSRDPAATPAELAEFVNEQVPYYQHLRNVEITDRIPRSMNGKIQRRDLRERILKRRNTMVTFVNRLTVTGCPEEFEELLHGIAEHMTAQPGFLSRRLFRSQRNPSVYVEVADWTDAESHRNAMQSPAFGERVAKLKAIATAEPDIFTEVAAPGATSN